jgi:hypothetical protein
MLPNHQNEMCVWWMWLVWLNHHWWNYVGTTDWFVGLIPNKLNPMIGIHLRGVREFALWWNLGWSRPLTGPIAPILMYYKIPWQICCVELYTVLVCRQAKPLVEITFSGFPIFCISTVYQDPLLLWLWLLLHHYNSEYSTKLHLL